VDKDSTKVRILGEGGGYLEPTMDKVPETGRMRAYYKIPVGASVSITSSDASCFDGDFKNGIYKIDGIEVKVTWLDTATGPVTIDFTMPEQDVRMWMPEKNKFGNSAGKIVKITSEGGVEATFTATVNGETVTKELEANSVLELPADQTWTIKVTNAGTGTVVKDTIMGSQMENWAAEGVFNQNQTGYKIVYDSTFYAGYRVGVSPWVRATAENGSVAVDGYGTVVPAGMEVTLTYSKVYESDPDAKDVAGVMAVTDWNNARLATNDAEDLITFGSKYTITEDIGFYPVVKFNLDEGITATFKNSQAGGDSSKTFSLDSGDCYVVAEPISLDGAGTKRVFKGLVELTFAVEDGYGVIWRGAVGNEHDTVMAWNKGQAVPNTAKLATVTEVVSAKPWGGDKYEAWVKLETNGDIDEAYIDNLKDRLQIFDDLYLKNKGATNGVLTNLTDSNVRSDMKMKKTDFIAFLSPDIKDTIVVYARGAYEEKESLTAEKYEIKVVSGGEADPEWTNPFLSSKTAWIGFNLTGGPVELEVVEKTAK